MHIPEWLTFSALSGLMDAVAACNWVELSANDELTGAETAVDTTSIIGL